MVVQHNMSALFASNQLGRISGTQQKSTEKLSSGYRINRAADDAAGLSISEGMRRQIRGLSRASANCQDGISLVQTADGALEEVHSMLQRLNELAVTASNGTYTIDDRWSIQLEANNVISEINRIAKATDFNDLPLFDEQSANNKKLQPLLNNVDAMFSNDFTVTKGDNTVTIQGTHDQIVGMVSKFQDPTSDEAKGLLKLSDQLSSLQQHNGGGSYYISIASESMTFSFGGVQLDYGVGIQAGSETDPSNSIWIGLETINADTLGLNEIYTTNRTDVVQTIHHPEHTYTPGGGYGGGISVGGGSIGGGASDYTPGSPVTIPAYDETIYPAGFMSAENSKKALGIISNAIDKVSSKRAEFGAVQNRMEHTINNLNNTVENTQSAESKIRDTDMAEEMMRLSTQNILHQAGQSMLSQANKNADYIMSLLQ